MKRLFDLVVALPLLTFSLPVMLVIAVVVCLDSPGAAIFRQVRVGRNERGFTLLKFRSMRADTPELPTDEMARCPSRVTRTGRWLRRTSLDELPQLINVLRGEMSLVGPRPALPTQSELNRKRRAEGIEALTPGITGWAQVNGRDELDTDAKVACDAWYLQHRSLWLDLQILVQTLIPVVTGRGNR